jgi:rhamnosyltransferase
MINRALAEKASPIPVCAENHDYWIALVAALLGSIVHVNHRTILYRQHSNNVSGHYSNNSIKARFRRYYKRNDSVEKIIRGRFVMAATLLDYFANEISTNNHSLLKTYSDFDKLGKFKRVYFCINNAIVKNNFVQNLAFYYSLLRL